MKIIRQEKPGYLILLLRKSFKVKVAETIVFATLVIYLSITLGYNNPLFKVGAFISAILTLGISPLFYRMIMRPKYVLTETELMIEKTDSKVSIPLVKIKREDDVRHYYLVEGKRMIFNVSNDFLEEMDEQIAKITKRK